MAKEAHEEVVLVAIPKSKSGSTRGSRETKAPRQKAGIDAGQRAGGHRSSPTLGMELSESERKPKPRAIADMDEILWSSCRQTAESEIMKQFQLAQSLEEYYDSMCDVGKTLLSGEIHRKPQRIYDNRATKKYQRNKN